MSQPRFEIGLACAGAVSAGAYTAGVVSFLFDALNAFYEKKKQNAPDAIPHEVKLKAMSGSSAGGMCTALTAISICDGNVDKFKRSWVDMIDMKPLLNDDDLKKSTADLKSVLNCRIIDEIASKAINIDANSNHWPDYVDDSLDLMLTVTNLNGITYEVRMDSMQGSYFVKNHADYLHFKLCKPGSVPASQEPDIKYLDATSASALDNWDLLKTGAKATGAFPLALESRIISRKNNEYLNRKLSGMQKTSVYHDNVKPVFTNPGDGADYLYVDGGMTNNEPFELVHEVLLKTNDRKHNPRDGATADAAIIMVDPFPDFSNEFAYQTLGQDIESLFGSLITSLRQQSKFKLDELLMAMDENIFSRFLIAPSRSKFPPEVKRVMKNMSHVAGGAMDAFGGFIDRNFRNHDYLLGRRNCQQFLRQHFILEITNDLFKEWSADLKNKHKITIDGKDYLPIVPLVTDELKAQIEEPTWPKTTQQNLDEIEQLICTRAEGMIEHFLEVNDMVKVIEVVINLFKKKAAKKISDKAMKKISGELKEMGLI